MSDLTPDSYVLEFRVEAQRVDLLAPVASQTAHQGLSDPDAWKVSPALLSVIGLEQTVIADHAGNVVRLHQTWSATARIRVDRR